MEAREIKDLANLMDKRKGRILIRTPGRVKTNMRPIDYSPSEVRSLYEQS